MCGTFLPWRSFVHWKADATAPLQLYQVDPSVSDELRRAFKVPSLDEAERRVARRNAGFHDLSEALR